MATETIAATEGPVRALVEISDSRGFEADRRIWRWFAAWVAAARTNGTQLTAVKIGWFCFEWHATFVPQSGQAWMSLWKAEVEELSLITAGAVAAADDLDPGTVVVPATGMTVADVRRVLAPDVAPVGLPDDTPVVRPPVGNEAAVPSAPVGWDALVTHVRSRYHVVSEGPLMVQLSIDFGDGRSHSAVIARRSDRPGEEWAQISAPVGKVDEIELAPLAHQVERFVCGGVVIKGHYVSLRHSLPLANFTAGDVDAPLEVLLDLADTLEGNLTGRDDF